MSKKKYTTADLKKAIEQMEEEGLPLTAPIEVYLGDTLYDVESIGHFHIMPNLTIGLEEQETASGEEDE